MLIPANNNLNVSRSPHSIGLQNSVTVPVAYADNNWFIQNEHAYLTAGLQGMDIGRISMGGGATVRHYPCQGQMGLGCAGCNGGCGQNPTNGYQGLNGIMDGIDFSGTLSNMFDTWSGFDWLMFLGIALGIGYYLTEGGSNSNRSSHATRKTGRNRGRKYRQYSALKQKWEDVED